MKGTVTPQLEMMLPLHVRGPAGKVAEIRATIDTGFNDCLTLPPSFIQTLGLASMDEAFYILADGSRAKFSFYAAEIEWLGQWKRIPVVLVDAHTLVGTNLLLGTRLTVDMVDGGLVQIEKIPHA